MENSREELRMLRDQLFDRLDKLETMIQSLTTIDGKQILDNQDMRLLLKVCDRTLRRWRESKLLNSFKISGKVYYRAADVHQFLRSEYYAQQEMSNR